MKSGPLVNPKCWTVKATIHFILPTNSILFYEGLSFSIITELYLKIV